MKKFVMLVLAVSFLMIATAGCNALRGAGADISDAGKHMQKVGT